MTKSPQNFTQTLDGVTPEARNTRKLTSPWIQCHSHWNSEKLMIDRKMHSSRGRRYVSTVFQFPLQFVILFIAVLTVSCQNDLTPSVTSPVVYLEELKSCSLLCTLNTTAMPTTSDFPLSWSRTGGLPGNATVTNSNQTGNGGSVVYQSTLTFTPTALDNEITILCNAHVGSLTGSTRYTPRVIIPPDEPVITGPDEEKALVTTTWTCEVGGASRIAPNVYWRNARGQALMTGVNKTTTIQIQPNQNTVYLIKVMISIPLPAGGTFFNLSCIVVHELSQYNYRKTAVKAIAVLFPPQITKTGGDMIYTDKGQMPTLSCIITSSNPAATNVSWSKDGETLNLTSGRYGQVMVNSTSLTILSALPDDNGGYICTVSNSEGSTSFTTPTTLIVRYPPSINNTGNQTTGNGIAGDSLTISCPVDAVPPPTAIIWKRVINGQIETVNVAGNSRYSGGTVTNKQYDLTINPLQDDDAGTYFCQAVNDVGTGDGPNTTIIVHFDPVVIVPSYLEVQEGDNFTITCKIIMYSNVTSVVWTKGDTQLNIGGSSSKYSGGTVENPSLAVHYAGKTDSGTYKCQGSNGTTIVTGTTIVNVTYPPSINSTGNQTTGDGIVGGSLTIPCPVDAVPPPTAIIWKRVINGQIETVNVTGNSRYSGGTVTNKQYDLTINPLQDDDAGTYFCQAVNDMGTGDGPNVTVIVHFDPVVIVPSYLEVQEGNNFTINCKILMYPNVTSVVWTKGDTQLNIGSSSSKYSGGTVENPSLAVHFAGKADSGTYKCQGSNGTTIVTGTTVVNVTYPPSINSTGNQTTGDGIVGGSLTIPCPVDTVPPPTAIIWKRVINGQIETVNVTGNSRYSGGTVTNKQYDLTINPLEDDDAGTYFCQAVNDTGTVEGPNVTIIVHSDPVVIVPSYLEVQEGANFTINCKILMYPNVTSVVWTKGDTQLNIGSSSSKYSGGTVENPSLAVHFAGKTDSGTYKCQGSNGTTIITGTTVVNVTYPPSINSTGNQTTGDGIVGGSLTIPCPVDTVPPPTAIIWKRVINGQIETVNVTGNSRYSGGTVTNKQYDLTINPLEDDDAGTYFCQAVNDTGTVEGPNVTIIVHSDPVVIVPSYLEVQEGANFTINCKILMYPNVTSVVWTKGDTQLNIGSSSSKYSGGTVENPSLAVHFAGKTDSGTYKCQGSNGTTIITGTTVVNVTYPPSINSTGNQTTGDGIVGGSLTIPCPVDTVPPPTAIIWKRVINGQIETVNVTGNSRYSGGTVTNKQYDLTINPLEDDDAGTYFCQAVNDTGTVEGPNVTIIVHSDPVVIVPSYLEVQEGANFTINCKILMYPNVTSVVWTKGDTQLNIGSSSSKYSGGTVENPSLAVHFAGKTDSGTYKCQGSNGTTIITGTTVVNVTYPPSINSTGNQTTGDGIVGGSLTIPCPVDTVPPPTAIIWKRVINGQIETVNVTGNSRYSGGTVTNKQYDLTINPLEDDDAGTYFCQAVNDTGTVEGPNVTIIVHSDPVVIVPSYLEVQEGANFTINCKILMYPNVTSVVWTKGDTQLNIGSSSSKYSGGTVENPSLAVHFAGKTDSGTYKCQGSNGTTIITGTTVVNVTYPPSINSTGNQTTGDGIVGGSLTIPCPIDTVPPPTAIIWKRVINGQIETVNVTGNSRYSGGTVTNKQYDLTINPLEDDDAGTYFCQAVNVMGTVEGPNVTVIVHFDPIVTVPSYLEVQEGDNFTITCKIIMYSNVTSVVWTKGNTQLNIGDSSSKYSGGTVQNPSLTVHSAGKTDSGTYRCQGSNGTANVTGTTAVNVTYPPSINSTGNQTTNDGIAGGSLTISCPVDAVPPPTAIIWKRVINGHIETVNVTGNSRYIGGTVTNKQYDLTINPLQDDDAGTYFCQAVNDMGTGEGSNVTVIVHSDPVVIVPSYLEVHEGDNFTITCKIIMYSNVTSVFWTKGDIRLNIGGSSSKYSGGTVQNPSLVVHFAGKTDSGTYKCQGSNGTTIITGTTVVNVTYAPKIAVPTSDVIGNLPQTVTISCSIDAVPPATSITWLKKDVDSNSTTTVVIGGRISGGSLLTPSLNISDLKIEDAATYLCVASNGVDETTSNPVILQVHYKPIIINVNSTPEVLKIGDKFQLTCAAIAYPEEIRYEWYQGAVKVASTPEYTKLDASVSDYADFRCRVTNRVGVSLSDSITPNIQFLLQPVGPRKVTIRAKRYTTVNLECLANANPLTPSFAWYKEGILLQGALEMNRTMYLTLSNETDFGAYSCRAWNSDGDLNPATEYTVIEDTGNTSEESGLSTSIIILIVFMIIIFLIIVILLIVCCCLHGVCAKKRNVSKVNPTLATDTKHYNGESSLPPYDLKPNGNLTLNDDNDNIAFPIPRSKLSPINNHGSIISVPEKTGARPYHLPPLDPHDESTGANIRDDENRRSRKKKQKKYKSEDKNALTGSDERIDVNSPTS